MTGAYTSLYLSGNEGGFPVFSDLCAWGAMEQTSKQQEPICRPATFIWLSLIYLWSVPNTRIILILSYISTHKVAIFALDHCSSQQLWESSPEWQLPQTYDVNTGACMTEPGCHTLIEWRPITCGSIKVTLLYLHCICTIGMYDWMQFPGVTYVLCEIIILS